MSISSADPSTCLIRAHEGRSECLASRIAAEAGGERGPLSFTGPQTQEVKQTVHPKGVRFKWQVTLVLQGGTWKIADVASTPLGTALSPAKIDSTIKAAFKAVHHAALTNNPTRLPSYLAGDFLMNTANLMARYKANGVYNRYTSVPSIQKIILNDPEQIVVLATETLTLPDAIVDSSTQQVVQVLNAKGTRIKMQITLVPEGGTWKISSVAVLEFIAP